MKENVKNTINFDELERARKKARRREWVQSTMCNVKNWFYNNKDMIMFFGPAIIGLTTTSIKVVGKHLNLRKEQQVKEFYCYDRSLGHYWKLRRELSNSEWIEIDKRKKNGERLSDILDELKVLK